MIRVDCERWGDGCPRYKLLKSCALCRRFVRVWGVPHISNMEEELVDLFVRCPDE